MKESEIVDPDHEMRFAESIGTLRRGEDSSDELETVELPLESRMA